MQGVPHEVISARHFRKPSLNGTILPPKQDPKPQEDAPAPTLAPSAPNLVRSAPTLAPSAPNLARSAPTLAPPAPNLVRSAPNLAPSTPQITNAAKPTNPKEVVDQAAAPNPGNPAGVKTQWPKEWLKNFSAETLERSAAEAVPWKTKTLAAMSHAWTGYSRVYGADTVKPLSGLPGKRWANAAFTLVDSLSTLWLMGMHEEFNKAAEWIDTNLQFNYNGYVSVFETIIRELAGLLSAYALSKNPIFKIKAKELGDALMPAFAHGLPATQISLGRGTSKNGWFKGVLLAEAGTIQLEFRYLSEITGDAKYKMKGDAVMDILLQYGGDGGLVPVEWAGNGAKPGPISKRITLGATGDSYYEYLLKLWIQGGKKEPRFLNAWRLSMKQMSERLVKRSETYAVVLEEASAGKLIKKMDHLACFVGGMLALGERSIEDATSGYMELGKQITAACFDMYNRTKSGLAPEIIGWRDAAEPDNLFVKADAAHYLLRPETAESIFYLFYYTGNPMYRRWAGHIIDAIESQTKGPYGYCSVKDVRVSTPKRIDDMESFFFAETLKYLYLTFVTVPQEVIDLDKFVFNTEAHPLPILP